MIPFIIILHILSYDIWFYISHIMLHSKDLWQVHKIHHGKPHTELIFNDTNVGHWFENIFSPIGIFFPCFFIFDIYGLAISSALIGIRAMARHDNRCSWLIGNHHILHHKYPQYNFGEYWIDSLCGTRCPHETEYVYGMVYI